MVLAGLKRAPRYCPIDSLMLFFNIIHVGQTALKSISTHYVRANTSKLESIVEK
jgi:hypothetical protein